MPTNQPPVSVAISQGASSEAQATSPQRFADSISIRRAKIGFANLRSALGLPVLLAVSCGVALAVFCTMWAIEEGVPQPLAIMLGYCTVASSAFVCLAPLVIQSLAGKKGAAVAPKRGPNYAAWEVVSKLSVSDASRLWCDIEPGCPASQESIAWGTAMLDAIKRGELPVSAKDGSSQASSNPNWHTKITHARSAEVVGARARTLAAIPAEIGMRQNALGSASEQVRHK
jgi:hypothetical protein